MTAEFLLQRPIIIGAALRVARALPADTILAELSDGQFAQLAGMSHRAAATHRERITKWAEFLRGQFV